MKRPSEDRCAICGLRPVVSHRQNAKQVVAVDPAMHALLHRTASFARSDAPVVLEGETGSGKEVIARLLHGNSARAGGPFIAVNVAALPEELLESELFGHSRGAFTGATSDRTGLFAAAQKGTLFLDEIAEMALPLQAKLLRVLEDGEVRRVGENRSVDVDTRVIAATHQHLGRLVTEGRFREDLYYRLRVLRLRVPSLRERPRDILPLARQLIAEEGGELALATEAEKALEGHHWPGNVRELRNAVRHGIALATDGLIRAGDLPEEVHGAPLSSASSGRLGELRTLAEVERDHIQRVLSECEGSTTRAAEVLDIARSTLWRKMRAFDGLGT